MLTNRISKDFYLLESSESLDEIIVQNLKVKNWMK